MSNRLTLSLLTAVNAIVSPAYLVGGAVRDSVLGKEPKDYDFATPLTPDEVEAAVKAAGRRAYTTGKRFGTIGFKVEVDGAYHLVEVTTFRAEKYERGSRKPQVEYVADLSADLARRDFTVNAMALSPTGKLIDPYGGSDDLTSGTLRAVGHPTLRFKEDPLRMLRACRLAAQFGFAIEDATMRSMVKHAYLISSVSHERWGQELDKLLVSDANVGLLALYRSGLLAFMLPEVQAQVGFDQNSKYHSLTLFTHTLGVVQGVPADVDLRWAALLHDIGKPATRKLNAKTGYHNYVHHERVSALMTDGIADRLRWSNERRKAVVGLVRYHLDKTSPLKKADDAAGKTAFATEERESA